MMEEYNDYEEYENFDNSQEIKEAAERAREAALKKAIAENYVKLTTKGFNAQQIALWSISEIEDMMSTITYMIEYFEELEAYEKCAQLVKARKCLINQESYLPLM